MKYAYWRVSTKEQNEARQLKTFRECGEEIDRIFGDKQSGKSLDRPQFEQLMDLLQEGDVVFVASLDRLSRKYDDVATAWSNIVKKGADIVILDMKELLDTRKNKDLMGTFLTDIVVRLLSYVAQTERENIRKRQAEGMAAMPVVDGRKVSSKTGKGFGRSEKRPDNFNEVYRKQQSGEITLKQALEMTNIGRTRWYELAKEAV